MQKAVFLDKDGTLIEDLPYNVDPAKIVLQRDTMEGLQQLKAAGYLLVVITNQPGVARGYYTEEQLEQVKIRLNALMQPAGIGLDGFFYCPHHPAGTVSAYAIACSCRKPLPGLFLEAAAELDIDLGCSWMIGDILHDVEAGHRAGCRSVLIDNGNETEWQGGRGRTPDLIARSINEAAKYIAAAKMIES